LRKSWDEYFMEIATQVATRATCDRKHVGAVIVTDRYILSTGYNGSGEGEPHCDDVGHLMVDNHCIRTIHAEHNAIRQAQKRNLHAELKGAAIYTTASPCWNCIHRVKEVGITRVIFGEFYRDSRILDFCKEYNIELVDMTGSKASDVSQR
jgi:dCMP deaminase